jgi:hypothetical protein
VRIAALLSSVNQGALVRALLQLLQLKNIGTLAESMLASVDTWLYKNGGRALTLAYDGLDTGFGSAGDWEGRRDRFTEALVQVAGAARPARKVFFKLFLREDMWAAIKLQNQSHLAASKIELRWRPSDLWRMVLDTAMTSQTYAGVVRTLEPGVQPPWSVSDETLVRLLEPLWGSTVERGKLAKTINYVQKRTMDAAQRLFPRTVAQVLDVAIQEERKRGEPAPDRVIRFTSLREGIRHASRQRVDDLVKEYVVLAPYLELLRGSPPTGTRKQFIDRMAKKFRDKTRQGRRGRSGAAPGSLHAGPGGWGNVIDALRVVGVIGPYSRGSTVEEERLAVALLYRYGLDIPGSGLT